MAIESHGIWVRLGGSDKLGGRLCGSDRLGGSDKVCDGNYSANSSELLMASFVQLNVCAGFSDDR